MTDFLRCTVCEGAFVRPGRRGPVPKYCSPECKRSARREKAKAYHRRYYREVTKADPEKMAARRQYGKRYNRRPEVRERNRKRMLRRWQSDPEFRRKARRRNRTYHQREDVRARLNARRRERYATDPEYRREHIERTSGHRRSPYADVTIPAPYTGHRWLEMARKEVMPHRDLDPSVPWADDYHDEMGEAVLALLEGRDMSEAVHEFRRKEYVPRRLTQHISDYIGEDGNSYFDLVLPREPSAEEEVVAAETALVKARWAKPSQKRSGRHMESHTGQPSNRRSNSKRLSDHRRGTSPRP